MFGKFVLPSRLLVIHDDDSSRDFFLELLRVHGYQIFNIPGTPEALAIPRQGALVQVKGFLSYDVRQPNLLGFTLQNFIQHPEARVPLVILAGAAAKMNDDSPCGMLAAVLSFPSRSRRRRLVGWMNFCR